MKSLTTVTAALTVGMSSRASAAARTYNYNYTELAGFSQRSPTTTTTTTTHGPRTQLTVPRPTMKRKSEEQDRSFDNKRLTTDSQNNSNNNTNSKQSLSMTRNVSSDHRFQSGVLRRIPSVQEVGKLLGAVEEILSSSKSASEIEIERGERRFCILALSFCEAGLKYLVRHTAHQNVVTQIAMGVSQPMLEQMKKCDQLRKYAANLMARDFMPDEPVSPETIFHLKDSIMTRYDVTAKEEALMRDLCTTMCDEATLEEYSTAFAALTSTTGDLKPKMFSSDSRSPGSVICAKRGGNLLKLLKDAVKDYYRSGSTSDDVVRFKDNLGALEFDISDKEAIQQTMIEAEKLGEMLKSILKNMKETAWDSVASLALHVLAKELKFASERAAPSSESNDKPIAQPLAG